MQRFFVFVAVVSFALSGITFAQSGSPSPTTMDAFKKLEAAMKSEVESKAKPTGDESEGGPRARLSTAQAMVAEMASAIARGDSTNPEHMLNQLTAYFSSDEVRKEIENVRSAIRKDRQARENSYVAEMNAALKTAADAIHNAKNPEDLDQILKNLGRFRNYYGSEMSEEARNTQNKIQPTIHFVQQWQNYLLARKTANAEQARNSLQNLTNNEYVDLMPRSQILAELQKYPTGQEKNEPVTAEQVDSIVSKAKTLDDVSAVIKELRQLRNRSRGSSSSNPDSLGATLSALTAIQNTYHDFQAGLPTRLEMPAGGGNEATSSQIAVLRAQLLLLTLPRHLNLPAELAPKSGENVPGFLEHITQEARRRGDGALLLKVRNVQRLLTGSSFGDTDTNAITLVTAGQNQEAAEQFMLAVVSYQSALKTGSDAVPAKLIGERLAVLKTAHPQEYEQGMQLFLNPPRTERYPGFQPPGPYGRPGPPGANQDRADRTLSIPAASATATPGQTVPPKPVATTASSATPMPRKN